MANSGSAIARRRHTTIGSEKRRNTPAATIVSRAVYYHILALALAPVLQASQGQVERRPQFPPQSMMRIALPSPLDSRTIVSFC